MNQNRPGFGAVVRRSVRRGSVALAALVVAACTAAPAPHSGWAKYSIAAGAHSATVDQNGAPSSPLAGFTNVSSRSYRFIFGSGAAYVLSNPVQPDDQFDYNKLPGFSDCGTTDLSQDGAMFGWRWRLDTSPKRLEIVHYANNAGTHLYPNTPLVSFTQSELDAQPSLRYEVAVGGPGNSKYLFHIEGTVSGRSINVYAEHPRRCSATSPTGLKWASGFYFGGTSTAPQPLEGWILEP